MKKPTRGQEAKRPARAVLPTLELTIEKLNEDGLGIARHGSKEVLVFGAFPGEKLVAAIEHEGQRRIIARPLRITEPSPARRPSPCRKVGQCRGCPLLQIKDQEQLRFKKQSVINALSHFPKLRNISVPEVWQAPTALGYRTSAKLAIARQRRQLQIGLYQRGSHTVVDIGDCPLHHPLINQITQVVRDEIERQNLSVFDPRRGNGLLRYLAIRVSPAFNKAMVTFVTGERDFRRVTHLAKWLQRKVPEVVSIQQNINPSAGNTIFGRETIKMLGAVDLIDQVGDVKLRLGPTSFLQVNHDQAARIYRLVREWAALTREETAVDLYCGIGGIALHLAQDAGRVLGIELVEEAIRNARDNARMNGFDHCSFWSGDAADLSGELSAQVPQRSVIVVNPPRSGCEAEVLGTLVELEPRSLIYVSCNPETLARDLALLDEQGYRVDKLQPVDMFPQTPHVETVVLLQPKIRAGKSAGARSKP